MLSEAKHLIKTDSSLFKTDSSLSLRMTKRNARNDTLRKRPSYRANASERGHPNKRQGGEVAMKQAGKLQHSFVATLVQIATSG